MALLHSEWIKLRSLRSTRWTLALAVLTILTVGGVRAYALTNIWANESLQARAAEDPLVTSMAGIAIGQLVLGTIGVLSITSEFATGLIRPTFTATPQRRAVLFSKITLVGGCALIVGELTAFASFALGCVLYTGQHIGVTIGDPGALRAVVNAGLYMTVVALIGLGLGTVLRHTAGAIAALFGLTLIIPGILGGLPEPWRTQYGRFGLIQAVTQAIATHPSPGLFSPMISMLICVGYAVLALTVATLVIIRRDA